MSVMDYKLNGKEVSLEVSPQEIFTPNAVTLLFAKALEIREGDVVFDIGTGVGPLAIYSALQGASKVCAVDPVKMQCDFARKNVTNYGLENKVEVYNGRFFEPLNGEKADVIISDVSGIAEGIARNMESKGISWYPSGVPTGGRDGTEVIMKVLDDARDYLKPDGRLYFPIASLSAHEKLKRHAESLYDLEAKVDGKNFPLTPEQAELIKEVGEEGTYELYKKGQRDVWKGWIFEARPR